MDETSNMLLISDFSLPVLTHQNVLQRKFNLLAQQLGARHFVCSLQGLFCPNKEELGQLYHSDVSNEMF